MKTKNASISIAISSSILLVGLSGKASADQFHYNNVIMGERAVGMGGAYTAVADDASGVFYNPGGLAFALSNDISGSANAFYSKKVVYKNIKDLGGADFTETAGGTFAPFFGVLQKLDKYVNGLVGAFAYYTSDTELKDQDDLFQNISVSNSADIVRFHRTVQHRAATTNIAAAGGIRLNNSISIGMGLNYIQVNELTQEYQDFEAKVDDQTVGDRAITRINTQNIRESLTAHGVENSIGVQVAVSNSLALGLTMRKGMYVSQKYESSSERTQMVAVGGSKNHAHSTADGKSNKFDKPLGTMPGEARVGVAWFASTRYLFTADISHRESAQGADKIGGTVLYDRRAVTNYAAGAEIYVLPSMPLRLGLFTNNDSRQETKDVPVSKPHDHIDYVGESLFIAWVQPNSQIALGTVVQQGKGEARKVTNSPLVQKVEASAWNVGFSATHSF